jgi:hypothetical protein
VLAITFYHKSPRWDFNAFGHQNHKVHTLPGSTSICGGQRAPCRANERDQRAGYGSFSYSNDLYANDHVEISGKKCSYQFHRRRVLVNLQLQFTNAHADSAHICPSKLHHTHQTNNKMSKLLAKCSRLETNKRPDNRFPASYLGRRRMRTSIPKKSSVPAEGPLLFAVRSTVAKTLQLRLFFQRIFRFSIRT